MKEKEVTKLYNSITNIDEKYIEEAQHSKIMPRKLKRPMLIAVCFAALFVLCGFRYVLSIYWGTGSAENISFDNLTQPFATITSDNGNITEVEDTAWQKSDMIVDYTDIFADNSICYSLDGNNIPALYFSPAYMIIFAQKDGTGWILDAKEELIFNLSLNEKQNLELEFGYVLNGQYHELSSVTGHDFREILQADENGEYYLCVTNRSSANAVITSGNIEQTSEQ